MQFPRFVLIVGCSVLMLSGCPVGVPVDTLTYALEITGLTFVEAKGDSLNDFDVAVGGAFPAMGGIVPAVWRGRGRSVRER